MTVQQLAHLRSAMSKPISEYTVKQLRAMIAAVGMSDDLIEKSELRARAVEARKRGWSHFVMGAAIKGDEAQMRLLLEHIESVDFVDKVTEKTGHWLVTAPDDDKRTTTPLGQAAGWGHLRIVTLLLKHGASANLTSETGTPIWGAAQYGYVEIAKLLLRHDADVNIPDSEGCFPLHAAAEGGHLPMVQLLLANGADAKATTKLGATPLRCALNAKQRPCAEAILASLRGPEDVDPQTAKGRRSRALNEMEKRARDKTNAELRQSRDAGPQRQERGADAVPMPHLPPNIAQMLRNPNFMRESCEQMLKQDSPEAQIEGACGLFYRCNDKERGMNAMIAITRRFPNIARPFYELGVVKADFTGSLNEAIEAFKTCIRVDPTYRDAHSNLVFTLKQAGRIEEYREAMARALTAETGSKKNLLKSFDMVCEGCFQVDPTMADIRMETTDRPFSSYTFNTGTAPQKLSYCAGCNVALYCCQRCQKESWSDHKKICSQLKKLKDETKAPGYEVNNFIANGDIEQAMKAAVAAVGGENASLATRMSAGMAVFGANTSNERASDKASTSTIEDLD